MSIRAYEMIFQAFGEEFREKGNRLEADCPNCGKENRLSVSKEPVEGHYPCRCAACNWSGNTISLMKVLYEAIPAASTTEKDWNRLSARRNGLDPYIPQIDGAKLLPSKRWCFPSYVSERSAVLAFWDERPRMENGKPAYKADGSPKSQPVMFPADHFGYWEFGSVASASAVVITEGYWDGWAAKQLLETDPMAFDRIFGEDLGEIAVLAIPGVHSFKREWRKYLKGKIALFSFDDDKPDKLGRVAADDGFKKTALMIAPYARAMYRLHWPTFKDSLKLYSPRTTRLEETKDLNDCFGSDWEPDQVLDAWSKSFQPASIEPTADSIQCDTLKEFLEYLRRYITTTPHSERTAVLCLAIVASSWYPDQNPLWAFLYGPTGIGKTTLLDVLKKSEFVHCEDAFRASAFVSGYRPAPGEEKTSLFEKVVGKCMIVGEWTVNMTASADEQARTNGVLRRLYEGEFSQTYGNGVEVKHDGRFGMICAVTDAIKTRKTAHLGERFFRIDLHGTLFDNVEEDPDDEPEIEHILRAIRNTSAGPEWTVAKKSVQLAAASYLLYLHEKFREEPVVPDSFHRRIAYIAQITETLRHHVERNEHDDVDETQRSGIGSRVATQFTRLMAAVAMVLDKDEPDEECWEYIQRVATDSMSSQPFKVCRLLYGGGRRPWLDTYAICDYLQVTRPTATKLLRNMLEIKIVQKKGKVNKSGAHIADEWALTEKFGNFWQKAKMELQDAFANHEAVLDGATREPDVYTHVANPIVELDLPPVLPPTSPFAPRPKPVSGVLIVPRASTNGNGKHPQPEKPRIVNGTAKPAAKKPIVIVAKKK